MEIVILGKSREMNSTLSLFLFAGALGSLPFECKRKTRDETQHSTRLAETKKPTDKLRDGKKKTERERERESNLSFVRTASYVELGELASQKHLARVPFGSSFKLLVGNTNSASPFL